MNPTKLLPVAALVLTATFATSNSHADAIGSRNAQPATTRFAQPPPRVAAEQPMPPPHVRRPALSRETLTKLVIARRKLQIERLRQYRMRGIFPRNTYSNKVLRVLIDDGGRLCAVANLMALDGKRALVDATARTNRFVVFGQLKSGPLVDWVLTSGFTIEEVNAIQLPDSRIRERVWKQDVERERLRLTLHLNNIEKLLLAQQTKSLELIVDRLMARPELAAALVHQASITAKSA